MKKINLGFSTGVYYPVDTDLSSVLVKLLAEQNQLVEVNIASPEEFSLLSARDIDVINQFEKKTIHAPFKNCLYGYETQQLLSNLLELAKKISAEYIVFHPDTVADFEPIHTTLGQLAGFENMDVRKDFGNTVADLQNVFHKCPTSGWVCDLNHVYTIDTSMQLGLDLHKQLGDRLYGYHISGYKDENTLHTCLYKTGENEILAGIENFTVPIIDEGGFPSDPNFLQNERRYVEDFFEE